MKKNILLAVVAASLTAVPVMADDLGVEVGLNAFMADSDNTLNEAKTTYGIEASFEHFIPLIPNAKIAVQDVEAGGTKHRLSHANLYYQVLDNDVVQADIGAGYSAITSGEFYDGKEYEEKSANINAMASLNLTENFSVFADVTYMPNSDMKGFDAEVGVGYELEFAMIDVDLTASYRAMEHDFGGRNGSEMMTTDGFNVGFSVGF
ncbi:hypothetical protein [Vibrio crassostreae]|uniref:hypothetical protein n=1 Tax=Vibrio crassostreae TaxID=246167 RepID=UPI001B3146D8|nr:hypothetical protein [Vibrio crassostreae]